MRAHNPVEAPPNGRYSQGVEVSTPGRLLHVSGQVPQSPDGVVLAGIYDERWLLEIEAIAFAGVET